MLARWLLTAMVTATLASAQRGGGMGGGGSMGGEGVSGHGVARMQQQTKLDQIAEKLKLSKEQRDQVHEIFLDAMEAGKPLAAEILKGRELLAGAMITGKSEDDIRKMMDQYAGLTSKMTDLEIGAFTKVYALLKPNQQPKAPVAFELMAGMFGWQKGPTVRTRNREGN